MAYYVSRAVECRASKCCDELLLSFIANQAIIINQSNLSMQAFLNPLSLLTAEPLGFYLFAESLYVNEKILRNLIQRAVDLNKTNEAEQIYEFIKANSQRSRDIDNKMVQIFASDANQNKTIQILREINNLYRPRSTKQKSHRFHKEQIKNMMQAINGRNDKMGMIETLQSALNALSAMRVKESEHELLSYFERFQVVKLFEAEIAAHIKLYDLACSHNKAEKHILTAIKSWRHDYSFLIPVTKHMNSIHIYLHYIVDEAVNKWICRHLLYWSWIKGKIAGKQIKICTESVRLAKSLDNTMKEWVIPDGYAMNQTHIDPVRVSREVFVFLPQVYRKTLLNLAGRS